MTFNKYVHFCGKEARIIYLKRKYIKYSWEQYSNLKRGNIMLLLGTLKKAHRS